MKFKTKLSKTILAMMLFAILLAGQAFAASSNDFEIGTQNLNNTVENSARVGDRLTKPEKGWKRYDNTNDKIEYVGRNWNHIINSPLGQYKQSHSFTGYKDNFMQFKFKGNKLRFLTYTSDLSSDNMRVFVDGQEYIVDNSINKYNGAVLAFEIKELADKEHLVVIRGGNPKSNGVTHFITFDAIDIDENGELKPYGPVQEDIKASSLELNKSTLDLNVGGNDTLIATVSPENVTNKAVKWTTSNESIVTVDENGKVTAIKAGTATITATTQDGSNLSKSCNVTVIEPTGSEDKLATSLTLNKTSLEVDVDKTALITPTVKPDDATNKTVKWVSSDPSIAIVYSNGKVKGVKPGKVTITATTQDGSNLSATCEVTVREPQGGEVEATEATLGITMVSGAVHQYDLSMTEVNKFIAWIDGRANGQGSPYYVLEKKTDTGSTIKEYIMYDKIESFTVNPVK